MSWGEGNRFQVLEDGSYYYRAGTQTNCGGIAGIHVDLKYCPGEELELAFRENLDWDGADEMAVPGARLEAAFRDALVEGARQIHWRMAKGRGVRFELIDALVHPIDGNQRQFKMAGSMVLKEWLERTAEE